MGNSVVIPSFHDWYTQPLKKQKIIINSHLDAGQFFLVFDGKNAQNQDIIIKAYVYNEPLQNLDTVKSSEIYFRKLSEHSTEMNGIVNFTYIIQENMIFLFRPKFHKSYNFVEFCSYQQPVLEPIEKLFIFYQIYNIISKLHKIGLAHGDLKPSNIFINGHDLDLCIVDPAPFKPNRIQQSRLHVFYHYFTTLPDSGCYLAPERISRIRQKDARESSSQNSPHQKNSPKNTESKNKIEDSDNSSDKEDDDSDEKKSDENDDIDEDETRQVDLKMADIFSFGCIIAFLYLNGEHLFDLSKLHQYANGQIDIRKDLSSINDQKIIDIIVGLISLDIEKRRKTMNRLDQLFDNFFSVFSKLFCEYRNDESFISQPQQQIPKFTKIVHELFENGRLLLFNFFFDQLLKMRNVQSIIYCVQEITKFVTYTRATDNTTKTSPENIFYSIEFPENGGISATIKMTRVIPLFLTIIENNIQSPLIFKQCIIAILDVIKTIDQFPPSLKDYIECYLKVELDRLVLMNRSKNFLIGLASVAPFYVYRLKRFVPEESLLPISSSFSSIFGQECSSYVFSAFSHSMIAVARLINSNNNNIVGNEKDIKSKNENESKSKHKDSKIHKNKDNDKEADKDKDKHKEKKKDKKEDKEKHKDKKSDKEEKEKTKDKEKHKDEEKTKDDEKEKKEEKHSDKEKKKDKGEEKDKDEESHKEKKEHKDKDKEGHKTKDKEKVKEEHKDKDHKDKEEKKDHKDKEHKDKEHKDKEEKKDHKDKEHKDKEHKDKEHKDKEHKDKEHKDKEHKDKEEHKYKEHENKEEKKDHKDKEKEEKKDKEKEEKKDHKDKEHKDKDHKDKEEKKDHKDKEHKDKEEHKYKEHENKEEKKDKEKKDHKDKEKEEKKDHKDKEHKDKEHKDKEHKDKEHKDKEHKDKEEHKYKEHENKEEKKDHKDKEKEEKKDKEKEEKKDKEKEEKKDKEKEEKKDKGKKDHKDKDKTHKHKKKVDIDDVFDSFENQNAYLYSDDDEDDPKARDEEGHEPPTDSSIADYDRLSLESGYGVLNSFFFYILSMYNSTDIFYKKEALKIILEFYKCSKHDRESRKKYHQIFNESLIPILVHILSREIVFVRDSSSSFELTEKTQEECELVVSIFTFLTGLCIESTKRIYSLSDVQLDPQELFSYSLGYQFYNIASEYMNKSVDPSVEHCAYRFMKTLSYQLKDFIFFKTYLDDSKKISRISNSQSYSSLSRRINFSNNGEFWSSRNLDTSVNGRDNIMKFPLIPTDQFNSQKVKNKKQLFSPRFIASFHAETIPISHVLCTSNICIVIEKSNRVRWISLPPIYERFKEENPKTVDINFNFLFHNERFVNNVQQFTQIRSKVLREKVTAATMMPQISSSQNSGSFIIGYDNGAIDQNDLSTSQRTRLFDGNKRVTLKSNGSQFSSFYMASTMSSVAFNSINLNQPASSFSMSDDADDSIISIKPISESCIVFANKIGTVRLIDTRTTDVSLSLSFDPEIGGIADLCSWNDVMVGVGFSAGLVSMIDVRMFQPFLFNVLQRSSLTKIIPMNSKSDQLSSQFPQSKKSSLFSSSSFMVLNDDDEQVAEVYREPLNKPILTYNCSENEFDKSHKIRTAIPFAGGAIAIDDISASFITLNTQLYEASNKYDLYQSRRIYDSFISPLSISESNLDSSNAQRNLSVRIPLKTQHKMSSVHKHTGKITCATSYYDANSNSSSIISCDNLGFVNLWNVSG